MDNRPVTVPPDSPFNCLISACIRPLCSCFKIESINVLCVLFTSLASLIFCAIGCVWFSKNALVKLGRPVGVLEYDSFIASKTLAKEFAAQSCMSLTPDSSSISFIIFFSLAISFFLRTDALSTSTRTPLCFMSKITGSTLISNSNTFQRFWSSKCILKWFQSLSVKAASCVA